VSGLLLNAFRALGPGATRREIASVAAALRNSGDEEVEGLLDDWEGWERLEAIADEGAYGFALDLVMAFRNPEGFAELVRDQDEHLSTGQVD
jgi:hypothetical protein